MQAKISGYFSTFDILLEITTKQAQGEESPILEIPTYI